ncbi:hypothetical protein EZV62_008161 [Acer yangbiense]|uniref:RNase H type-1 domain-containing protein n=1 Tax=Acer yangbiense TaxID=1000413 RepID=A0A5C7IEN9_9ROSI|nr:hypothetical protein EZV62_008161 [Acer yangbiense]
MVALAHDFQVFSPKVREDVWLVRHLKNPTGNWNALLLKQLFVNDDAKVIFSIPRAPNNRDDTLCWHYSANGVYSISSGYKLGVSMEDVNSCSRVKGGRGCLSCSMPFESSTHALWGCPGLNKVREMDTDNLERLCIVWWRIWFLRNHLVHSIEKFVVEDIVPWCVEFLDEYKAANDISYALAIYMGLLFATVSGLELVEVESDAQVVVNLINSKSHNYAEVGMIICDIVELLKSMLGSRVSYASREVNVVAHELAKLGLPFYEDRI